MRSKAPDWLRYGARSFAVYAALTALTLYWTRGFASALEMSLVGAVLPAALGGASLGARMPIDAAAWTANRLPLRRLSDLWRPQIVGLRLAAGAALLVFLVWAAAAGEPLMRVLAAHGVLAGVFLASMGIAALWSLLVGSRRPAVLLTLLAWTPLWTAFIWLPAAFPPGPPLLNAALNMNPAMGIVSALRLQNLFWNPLLYGTLPYAEYAVSMRGPLFHFILWSAVGASCSFLALSILRRKRGA